MAILPIIMSKIIVSGLSFTILLMACMAQSKKSKERIVIDYNPPIIAAPYKPPPPIKTIGMAKIFYDKKTDRSMVLVPGLPISSFWKVDGYCYIDFSFENAGKKIIQPQMITLTFDTYVGDKRFVQRRGLIISVDQKIILKDKARFDSGHSNGKDYSIKLKQEISWETYLKMVNAKSLKFQLGKENLELSQKWIASLPDLQKTIE